MPAALPIGEEEVQRELTRYLEDAWAPVISSDVDGANALPLQLDHRERELQAGLGDPVEWRARSTWDRHPR